MATSVHTVTCAHCGNDIMLGAQHIVRGYEALCSDCVTRASNAVLADKGFEPAPAGYAPNQLPLPFAVDYATRDEVVYQRVRQGIDYEFTFDAELNPREAYVTRLSATSTLIRQTDPALAAADPQAADRFYVVNVAQVWYVLASSPHRLECVFCRGIIPASVTYAASPYSPTSLWSEHVGHIACCLTAELQNGVTSWPRAGCKNPLSTPVPAVHGESRSIIPDPHWDCDHDAPLQATD